MSYSCHYRSLDSVRVYADSILNEGLISNDNRAEALNNLAFYYTAKMQYDVADSLLAEVEKSSDNHIELMVASVQQMRLCQRRSDNKSFYEHRQHALNHQSRIYEELSEGHSVKLDTLRNNFLGILLSEHQSTLTEHDLKRLRYAESEFCIVSSAYYYYVGLISEASQAMDAFDAELIHQTDTAQYLAYLYNIGSGGILTHGSVAEIAQLEIDLLLRCYQLASQYGYSFWKANAMQAISEHLMSSEQGELLLSENRSAIGYLNTENVADSLLAGNLAERALNLFREYGDVYQIAAAWRSLSDCYFALGDYDDMIYCLNHALEDSKNVEAAPSLLASIHEKLSIAYAAKNDKSQSDYHRNLYLDLQENTRQDRQLEARAGLLASSIKVMNVMILLIVVLLILLVCVLSYLLFRRRRMKRLGQDANTSTLQKIRKEYETQQQELDDEDEELDEGIAMCHLNLERQREVYEEHRAKMSLLDSLTPLLDRMLHEADCLNNRQEDDAKRHERLAYISELIQQINTTNDFLTDWIRLKQGDISLRIETFAVADVFELVAKSATSFRRHGITLDIEDYGLTAKADRTLTLFMVNTLCDNARKFTPSGGTVTVSAQETGDMVEISVADTGSGMPEEQLQSLFDPKTIHDNGTTKGGAEQSHGFGLLNCKGIIEKYKKTSPLFNLCAIKAESNEGQGTRISFTLPKGVRRILTVLSLLCAMGTPSVSATVKDSVPSPQPTTAKNNAAQPGSPAAFVDSLYNCNVSGDYERALYYAERCVRSLNAEYQNLTSSNNDTLFIYDNISATAAEIRWLRNGVRMPYDVIVTLRNETAVAALALHNYSVYDYNNAARSLLFRELSVDKSLEDYYQQMRETESNRGVAMMLLTILVLAFVPIYYFLYYRHVIDDTNNAISKMQNDVDERRLALQIKHDEHQRLAFEIDRLHVANNVMSNSLSTIKHETMYFPSRIRQMVDTGESSEELGELAHYYRSLYEALSRQARYNCRQQLPMAVLIDILEGKLARLSGVRRTELEKKSDGAFTIYHVHVSKPDQPTQRLVTQIVRDLGEITNLRRCGIVEKDDVLIVTVPRMEREN